MWQNTIVVKAGFTFNSSGVLTAMPESDDIIMVDEFRGDPSNSSLLSAAEISPKKTALDFLVTGSIDVPDDTCEHAFSLSISNAHRTVWEKSALLFGPRAWRHALFGSSPSIPKSITDSELRWENAYGGATQDPNDDERWYRFDRNPAGIGWVNTKWKRPTTLPTIEQYPLLTRPQKQPAPVGFGPVAMTWAPRWDAFQTLNSERALQGGNPYPSSPSHHLFQCAPEDQQLPFAYLHEHQLTLTGIYQDHPEITIPLIVPPLELVLRNTAEPDHSLTVQWDMLLLDIDRKTLHWVGRTGIPSNPNSLEMRQCALALPISNLGKKG